MIKQSLLWTTLVALPLVGGVYGAEKSEAKKPYETIFNQVPGEVFDKIDQYLNSQDSGRLQQASLELKALVHSATERSIKSVKSHLNCVNPGAANTNTWVKKRLNQLVYGHSLHPLLHRAFIEKLKEEQFLFVPHESPLESVLVNVPGLRRISLRVGLEKSSLAPKLYEALFGHALPKGENLPDALDHLAACLPVHGIYVSVDLVPTDEAQNDILLRFFKANREGLIEKLRKMGEHQRYYSFGVTQHDEVLTQDKPYNIIVNQRQLALLKRQGLLANHPHRIILKIKEAPEGVLSLNTAQLPDNVGKLRLVDNDHLCTEIGNEFLHECTGLTSLDTSGLRNVKSIGDTFLGRCLNLTSLDTTGLQNLESIEKGFLRNCPNLTSLDTRGLQNVKSIGDEFLMQCTGLTSLDTSGLQKVESIGNDFLLSCSNLTSLNMSKLQKVESIGWQFLMGCTGLTSLDMSKLQKVESIGDVFLYGCTGLDVDPKQLRKEILKRGRAKVAQKKSQT
ncbi:MAG: leucine-rich repeat domain-containing protein [Alphaproteobacteria bacterium]|nr:leucine-rich repeat domain-containing protein [Alphaproteobacteria bacterium]